MMLVAAAGVDRGWVTVLAGGPAPVLRGIFLGLPGLRLTFTACSAGCAVTGTAAGVSDLAPASAAWGIRLSTKT